MHDFHFLFCYSNQILPKFLSFAQLIREITDAKTQKWTIPPKQMALTMNVSTNKPALIIPNLPLIPAHLHDTLIKFYLPLIVKGWKDLEKKFHFSFNIAKFA